MKPYKNYSKFYDAVEGDKKEYIKFIVKCIRRFKPEAKSVLELGCGTGYILQGLIKNNYEVEGLDISDDMLNVAKAKNLDCVLYKQDMTNFNTHKKYDVVISLYDTYNHLLKIQDWESSFKTVKKHLKPNGVFIFDINTKERLLKICKEGPVTVYFGKNKYVINIKSIKNDIFEWEVTIFEKQGGGYIKHVDVIKEYGAETSDVLKLLKKHFKDIKMFDGEDFILAKNAERIYFACR